MCCLIILYRSWYNSSPRAQSAQPPVSHRLTQCALHLLRKRLGNQGRWRGQLLFNLMVVLSDFLQALLIFSKQAIEISWVFKDLSTQLINKDEMQQASILCETKQMIPWDHLARGTEVGRVWQGRINMQSLESNISNHNKHQEDCEEL